MTNYNPNIHYGRIAVRPNRRSIRLKDYDYSQAGLYFITLCCKNRVHLFGHVENSEMILNEYGKIAHNEWANSENIRDNIRIHEFIIMPNHIHGIIEILFQKGESRSGELQFAPTEFKSPSQTIGSIIRGYKIATIKRIKEKIKSELEEIQSGESRIGSESKESRTGELQFAPTAPTAPTTAKIIQLNYKIWQRNYYEIIIRDSNAYDNISNYIINNPRKWKENKFHRYK